MDNFLLASLYMRNVCSRSFLGMRFCFLVNRFSHFPDTEKQKVSERWSNRVQRSRDRWRLSTPGTDRLLCSCMHNLNTVIRNNIHGG